MREFKLLFVVSLAASLLMIGVGMIVALLPNRILALSGSLIDVGYVASFFAISYLLVQLPIGNLADRFGAKRFLVFGYLLCSLSGIVFFFGSTPNTIFLGRFIQGAGEAPIWALGPALLSLAYPHAKGKVIGIYNAAIHAGLTLGPLLGLIFFTTGQSNTPFMIFFVLCATGGIMLLVFLPHTLPTKIQTRHQASGLRNLLKLLMARDPVITLSGICLYGAGYGIFVSVLPGSLLLYNGFGSFETGVFFILFYLAISVSQLIVGPLSDRHGRHPYMIAGLIMTAIGIGLFDQFQLPSIYLPLTLASFGMGIYCVSSMAHLNECVPPQLKGAISGSYYLSWGLGYFLGPLLIGLADAANPQLGYYILASLIGLQTAAVFHFKT